MHPERGRDIIRMLTLGHALNASAGEASLDRHLANPRGEDPGPSQTWVPPDVRDDKQLIAAVEWLRIRAPAVVPR